MMQFTIQLLIYFEILKYSPSVFYIYFVYTLNTPEQTVQTFMSYLSQLLKGKDDKEKVIIQIQYNC